VNSHRIFTEQFRRNSDLVYNGRRGVDKLNACRVWTPVQLPQPVRTISNAVAMRHRSALPWPSLVSLYSYRDHASDRFH